MSINWEQLRKEEWPVLETMTFLDAACVSFAPQRIVRAMKDFADFTARQDEENSSAHHIAMDAKRNKAYAEACKLLNAEPEEIAVVESTTHGLNIAANAIPLKDGDNIITTNLEFIQVALPWCAIRQEKAIDIRVAKTADGRFYAKDFEALCDENTKLIVISSVEWCNGWKMNLKEIGEMCKSRGIFLVVDAVQLISYKERLLCSEMEYTAKPSSVRIASSLLALCSRYGKECADGSVYIPIRFTHEELANLNNLNRVTVSKFYQSLQQKRIISNNSGYITVLDLAQLMLFVDQEK